MVKTYKDRGVQVGRRWKIITFFLLWTTLIMADAVTDMEQRIKNIEKQIAEKNSRIKNIDAQTQKIEKQILETERDILEIAKDREKILNKEVKVEELVKETFERIEKVEGKVGSFVHLRKEKALEEARILDEKIARGEKVGALAGVPVAIKDNIGIKGRYHYCLFKNIGKL